MHLLQTNHSMSPTLDGLGKYVCDFSVATKSNREADKCFCFGEQTSLSQLSLENSRHSKALVPLKATVRSICGFVATNHSKEATEIQIFFANKHT